MGVDFVLEDVSEALEETLWSVMIVCRIISLKHLIIYFTSSTLQAPDHVSELLQGEVGVPHLHHDVHHLLLYPGHLLQSQVVDLFCRHVGRGVELETLFVEFNTNIR